MPISIFLNIEILVSFLFFVFCVSLFYNPNPFPSIEAPAIFTVPLKDTSVTEKKSVTLTCEVTKPCKKVKWFKNGKPIKSEKGLKISSKDKSHSLSIAKCSQQDEGEYTIQMGEESSTAKLFVDGKFP